MYGEENAVQRCRHHKNESVPGHLERARLAKHLRDQDKVVMRAAYRLPEKEGLPKLRDQAAWLERQYPSAAASLREGKEATLKLLMTILERFGIAEIDPEGEPFDPEHHEAMTIQPSDQAEPGSVLTVIQKGYVLNGRLLRPARVIVAAEPQADGAAAD